MQLQCIFHSCIYRIGIIRVGHVTTQLTACSPQADDVTVRGGAGQGWRALDRHRKPWHSSGALWMKTKKTKKTSSLLRCLLRCCLLMFRCHNKSFLVYTVYEYAYLIQAHVARSHRFSAIHAAVCGSPLLSFLLAPLSKTSPPPSSRTAALYEFSAREKK